MKIEKLFSLLIITTLLFSCGSTKTLKFTQKSDEITNTNSLTNFLSINKNPKVVLRVRNSSFNVTENDRNDYLYNSIDNQLLASGFIVRDRQLFNQIIENDKNNIDYTKLKEKSDTDIIIELIKINPKVLYETNKYYDKNDTEKEGRFIYKRYGASVQFKIVLISTNEFAGVYEFNYAPCTEGCDLSHSQTKIKNQRKMKQNRNKQIKGLLKGKEIYEGVERSQLEIFIKNATKKLVKAMRE